MIPPNAFGGLGRTPIDTARIYGSRPRGGRGGILGSFGRGGDGILSPSPSPLVGAPSTLYGSGGLLGARQPTPAAYQFDATPEPLSGFDQPTPDDGGGYGQQSLSSSTLTPPSPIVPTLAPGATTMTLGYAEPGSFGFPEGPPSSGALPSPGLRDPSAPNATPLTPPVGQMVPARTDQFDWQTPTQTAQAPVAESFYDSPYVTERNVQGGRQSSGTLNPWEPNPNPYPNMRPPGLFPPVTQPPPLVAGAPAAGPAMGYQQVPPSPIVPTPIIPDAGPAAPPGYYVVDTSDPQAAAGEFAAAYPDDPNYVYPTDENGNFVQTVGWTDESQYLPDLDAIEAQNRYIL